MAGLLGAALLRHLFWPPASRWNPVQGSVACGSKQNRPVAIPRSPARRGGVGQSLHYATLDVDSLQRLVGEEPDRFAVGGPEGFEARLGSRKWLGSFRIEGPEPELVAIAGLRRGKENDLASVRR